MKRLSPLRIQDIKENVNKIIINTKDISENEFYENDILYSAVLRWLELIGEAAKYVDEETKKLYPDIPWKMMAAMRDVAIHDYAELLQKRIWETIKQDIPKLKMQVEKIKPAH
ncbi:MAG: DUF86 domain-containing protein [bacterium]|nr:DUF86 domain-containing protein [bacterium]